MTRVSVVMPVLNEAGIIQRAIESMLGQELRGIELEVLAVDGGSTDGTRETLDRLAVAEPRLRVLDNPFVRTPSAMNIGLRHASGEYVAICGSHAVYDRDYVAVCLEELRKHDAVGCSGRVFVEPADDSLGAELVAWTLKSPFASSRKSFRTAPQGFVDSIAYPVFLKQPLIDVGGYNERLARNQDNDMNERLRAAGHRLYLTWRTSSRYRAQPGLRALGRYALRAGHWNFVTIRENPRAMRLRHFAPGFFLIGAGACLVGAAVAAVIRGGVTPALVAIAVAPIALHLAVGLCVGIATAVRVRRPGALFLPVSALLYHVSYGAGLLRALLRRERAAAVHAAPLA